MLKDNEVVPKNFKFDEIYTFENDNITNMAIALNSKDINIEKLSIFRLSMRDAFGAMWLSDYVDNGYIKDIKI